MKAVNQDGINLIKTYENFSARIYRCPAGIKTIGYGHVILPGEEFTVMNEEEAVILLSSDVTCAARAVGRLIRAPLKANQFNALVSFTFNVGAGALQRSTLRQKINRQEHELAPQELMRFVWCNGRRLLGLVRRRRAEGKLYML